MEARKRRMTGGRQRAGVRLARAVVVAALVAAGGVVWPVHGDIYMHNPRGSNDRNCERNENRNNGNRLFDSQNNDKGGYACPRAVGGAERSTGRQYFYAGSRVQVEWTMQHGCGSESNTECEVVVQYMCNDNTGGTWGNAGLRDGTPSDANDAATDRMNEGDAQNPRFGYHETVEYYKACTTRRRNQGLWLADQNVPTTGSAAQTRQNPNGARRGWECPEERDYYPYWHPTPWKDVAVLTSRPERCSSLYRRASQNVAPRFECLVPQPPGTPAGVRVSSVHSQQAPCLVDGHQWVQTPAWGLPAPECLPAPWGRDNHLGNTLGGHMPRYVWTVPDEAAGRACVLRLRYNISTAETPWDLDASRNKAASPIRQDPYLDLGLGENVSLAVNTNQYGRTFQDRSYVFDVRPRPASISASARIHNVNVAGKRGNIVQTYPAIEYQFVPQDLAATEGDYLHFQWAGSDYNPDRRPNNGEGGPVDPVGGAAQRADRSNVVPVPPATPHAHLPASVRDSAAAGWVSSASDFELWKRLAYIGQDLASCMSLQQLIDANKDANGNVNQEKLETDPRNCMKLNAAQTPVFDAGLVQIKKPGTFYYMSTRNNNFSNRSQKARIVAASSSSDDSAVVAAGATLAVVGAMAFGIGGSYFYAKKHPDSKVAAWIAKIPRCRRS